MNKRIIYYYQTFVGLKDILDSTNAVTHLHVSSIHFGKTNNIPYIHLNDNVPNDSLFDSLWLDLKQAKELNIKIVLMVGGAGGAFQTLFSDFDTYYPLLKNLINDKRDLIDGIDLDIEEYVDIKNVEKLIHILKSDFGRDFIITMAPVQYSMENDTPGMGGFVYKDIYSTCGNMIDYFNVQCYSDYSFNSYDTIIKNGYPEDKIVMGSISSQNLDSNLNTVKQCINVYPKFGGVFNWEYFDSPPDSIDHSKWSKLMNKISLLM